MEADQQRAARGNLGDVTRQIAALGGMTTQELREKFVEVYGYESGSRNRPYMQKKIAWQLSLDNLEQQLTEIFSRAALQLGVTNG